jgi:hypothetical protein
LRENKRIFGLTRDIKGLFGRKWGSFYLDIWFYLGYLAESHIFPHILSDSLYPALAKQRLYVDFCGFICVWEIRLITIIWVLFGKMWI